MGGFRRRVRRLRQRRCGVDGDGGARGAVVDRKPLRRIARPRCASIHPDTGRRCQLRPEHVGECVAAVVGMVTWMRLTH